MPAGADIDFAQCLLRRRQLDRATLSAIIDCLFRVTTIVKSSNKRRARLKERSHYDGFSLPGATYCFYKIFFA